MTDFLDTFKIIFGITFPGALLIILVIYGGIKWDEYQCKEKANYQELEYHWGIPEGCMVKDKEGKWIDYDRYRIME